METHYWISILYTIQLTAWTDAYGFDSRVSARFFKMKHKLQDIDGSTIISPEGHIRLLLAEFETPDINYRDNAAWVAGMLAAYMNMNGYSIVAEVRNGNSELVFKKSGAK